MAHELGTGDTFRATDVGAYFGEAGQTVPDPYFGGEGPARAGCRHCGGCMVGCRYNAKNTLPKNYLYLAEKRGARLWAESEVIDVRPIASSLPRQEGVRERYEVTFQASTSPLRRRMSVRAGNVIFSGGVMGTLGLLLRLRDSNSSLPHLSPRLGDMVRTNSEAVLGAIARTSTVDYSQGLAISSIFSLDAITRAEPTRYPDGSSLMRLFSAPLISLQAGIPRRFWMVIWILLPDDFARHDASGWAHNLPGHASADNRMRFRRGRSPWTCGAVSSGRAGYEIGAQVRGSHAGANFAVARMGWPWVSSANLLDLPHRPTSGGVPINKTAERRCGQASRPTIIRAVRHDARSPGNPGVNPALTITALAVRDDKSRPKN
jgi:cholesterol oxidase